MMRILLWDIDGTLIRSVRTGAYKDYTIPVLEEIFGTAGRLSEMQVSGMTDLQIVYEALSDHGFTQDEIFARVRSAGVAFDGRSEESYRQWDEVFRTAAGRARNVRSACRASSISVSARDWKYRVDGATRRWSWLGLSEFFTLPGAFGDESHNRRDLPARAAERIRKHLQMDLAPEQFIVIGDTPNDIDCARHFGARAVAVGTGRTYLREEIIACKPDALLPDLSDVDLVIRTLEKL